MKVQDIKIYTSCVESPYIFMDNNGFIVNNIIQSVGTINNIFFGGVDFFDSSKKLNNSNLSLTFQSIIFSSNYSLSFSLLNVNNKIETSNYSPFLIKTDTGWNINSEVTYKELSSIISASSFNNDNTNYSFSNCSLKEVTCQNDLSNQLNAIYKYTLLKNLTESDLLGGTTTDPSVSAWTNNWYINIDLNAYSDYSVFFLLVKNQDGKQIWCPLFRKDCMKRDKDSKDKNGNETSYAADYKNFIMLPWNGKDNKINLSIEQDKNGAVKVKFHCINEGNDGSFASSPWMNVFFQDLTIKLYGAFKYDIKWDFELK